MFRIELGLYDGPKWKTELFFERDTLGEARKMLTQIGEEFKSDAYVPYKQARVIDSDEKLRHYITDLWPNVWIPNGLAK